MLRPTTEPSKTQKMSKIERLSFKFEQFENLPGSAVLLEAIRPLEAELIRRGILNNPSTDTFHPLWFVAEKQRNQLLWMHGLSISDATNIEWWIDIPLLIERICSGTETSLDLDISTIESSSRYFQQLSELFLKIYRHSFEVSLIARSLAMERDNREKPIILLPSRC